MKPLSLNMSRYHKVADDGEKSTLVQHDTGHQVIIAHKALPREARNYLKALPLYDVDKADPTQAASSANPQSMARGGNIGARPTNPSHRDAVELLGDKEKFSDDKYSQSNPDYKKQLAQACQSKYSQGGEIKNEKSEGQNNDEIKENKSGEEKEGLARALAKRKGRAAHYDEGSSRGTVAASDANEPSPAPSQEQDDSPSPAQAPVIVNVGNGAPQPTVAQNAAAQGLQPALNAASSSQADQGPQPSGLGQAQSQLDQLQGNVPQANDVQQPAGAASVQNIQPGNQSPSFMGGVGQETKGQLQTAQAQGALGAAQAPALDQAAKDRADLAQKTMDSYNALNQERLANAQDIRNGHVDPNKYWDNHSKITTGLGLILAGFNPTNRPNAALEFLQNNIQRDTQAQMANLGSKQDILAHNMQQFGNLRAAADFTNVLKTDQVVNQLQAAAAKSQNAQQAGVFNTLAGQLQQSSAQKMLPLSAMQGAMSAMRNGSDPSEVLPQLRVAAPEMAKTVEDHLFPRGTPGGGGTTDIPITPEARKAVAAQSNILTKTQNLKNFIDANTVQGVLSPAHRGEGEALAAELAQFYRQGTGASTSESEQKTIGNFIDQKPGGFLSAYLNDPKLQALSGSMQDSINSIKNEFHVHPFLNEPAFQAPAQAPSAQTQSSPGAGASTQIGGKSYQSVYSPKLKRNVLVPQ
jgi:hypothetical protein